METQCTITTSVWQRPSSKCPYNPLQDITPSFLTSEAYPTAFRLYKDRVQQLSAELPLCHPDTNRPVDIVRLKICLTATEEPVDMRTSLARTVNQGPVEHRQYALFDVPAALGKASLKKDVARGITGCTSTSISRKRPKTVYVAPKKVLLEVSTHYRFVNITNGLVNTLSIWEPTWTFVIREILERFNGRKVQVRVHGGSQQYDGEKSRKLVAAFFDSMIPTVQGTPPINSSCQDGGSPGDGSISKRSKFRNKTSNQFKSKWETIDNREHADSSTSVLAMDY